MAAILESVVRKNLERAPFRERPERSKITSGADTHRKSYHNHQIAKAGPCLLCSVKNSSRLRVGGDAKDSTIIQSLVGHCTDVDFFQLNEMGSF